MNESQISIRQLADKSQIKGFTMIELILYLALATIVILFAFNYFLFVGFSRAKIEGTYLLSQTSQIIFSKIEKSTKQASGINLPVGGQSGNQLFLTFDQSEKNPTIFEKSGDALTMKEGIKTAQELHSKQIKIKEIKFTNFSDSVQVRLSLSYVRLLGRREYQVEQNWQNTYSLKP